MVFASLSIAVTLALLVWMTTPSVARPAYDADELSVYRAVLGSVPGRIRVDRPRTEDFVDGEWSVVASLATKLDDVHDAMPSVELVALSDLLMANLSRNAFPVDLADVGLCECHGSEDACGYCHSVWISRVGFDLDRDRALVYWTDRTDAYVDLLERRGAGWLRVDRWTEAFPRQTLSCCYF